MSTNLRRIKCKEGGLSFRICKKSYVRQEMRQRKNKGGNRQNFKKEERKGSKSSQKGNLKGQKRLLLCCPGMYEK